MKYLILLLSMTFLSCNAQENKCAQFKTGTFKYTDAKLRDWTITRTDSLQIEVNKINNSKIVGTIKWTSDCNFVLVYQEFINRKGHTKKGTEINVEIGEIVNESYHYIAKGDSYEITGNMLKIK